MNKDKNVQVINGCQYDVVVVQCSVMNRAVVMVFMLDETHVGKIEIDHNLESASAQYKVGEGDFVDGSYNYFELPKADEYAELATWIVNTHPNY